MKLSFLVVVFYCYLLYSTF